MENCNVCDHKNLLEVKFNNVLLRTDSSSKILHEYKSYICKNCARCNQ